MDYPGASPEIVGSEVTKRIEEAVNTVAGISALSSRSYRFDPAAQPIFNVAVLATDDTTSPQQLTTWARQVLQKRLENVRGVGAVTLVGGVDRQVSVQLKPEAMEALGISTEQVAAVLRSENQELPLGNVRSAELAWSRARPAAT